MYEYISYRKLVSRVEEEDWPPYSTGRHSSPRTGYELVRQPPAPTHFCAKFNAIVPAHIVGVADPDPFGTGLDPTFHFNTTPDPVM